jgi:hypothetical protein
VLDRYAVKLAFDHVLIGPTSNDEELVDAVSELDLEWFLGNDDSPEWQDAISREVPHLFDLGYVPAKVRTISYTLLISKISVTYYPCTH